MRLLTCRAMMIDEELDIGMDNIVVTLSDARPELMFNQMPGASSRFSSRNLMMDFLAKLLVSLTADAVSRLEVWF